MLHRLILRVLPELTLAVTDEQVRRRKRLVMFLPGLAAFAVYRLVKRLDPLSDPLLLLVVSGLISMATALWAYRMGRGAAAAAIWTEDGARQVGWVGGWIGFTYGVQLSLMVLALLKILAGYDFLRHPDGPAMMAIIIACTSVARDAFEIGHVRSLQVAGKPILTFPDGGSFRVLWREQPVVLILWALVGAMGAGFAAAAAAMGDVGRLAVVQFAVASLASGTLALAAFLAGRHPSGGWRAAVGSASWKDLFRFWWWPGLAFAATYFLVVWGGVNFVLRGEPRTALGHGLIAGLVGSLMGLYCYYLGCRRGLEDRVSQQVPASLLRCPFVFGILSKTSGAGAGQPAGMALGEPARRG